MQSVRVEPIAFCSHVIIMTNQNNYSSPAHIKTAGKMSHQSKPVVVVIGGGLAGLAAAGTLARSNKFTVRLLEASSRPGGRVRNAHRSGSDPLPLGATYFHGERGNSLLELAIQLGIVRREDGRDGKAVWTNVLSDGTELAVEEGERVFRDILQEAALLSLEQRQRSPEPLKDYISERFKERITAISPSLVGKCSVQALLECFLYVEGITYGTTYLHDMETSRFGDYEWLEGVHNLLFQGTPLQQIVDSLARDLPHDVLQLNCEVESIVWNQKQCPHPITVRCTNGDQYSADHVITTVSLGVLKNKLNSPFFTPPLPDDKQEAIASLGYGTVDKVFLKFPISLFSGEYCSLRLFYKDKKLAEKFPWTERLHRIHTIPGTNIVTLWFAGEDAARIEHLSETQLADGICHILENILHKPIPPPVMVVASKWYSDRLFRGSYSYPAVGSTRLHQTTLGAALNGSTPLQLLFAGEATHPTLYGSANGAYDTGLEAARTLITLYTSKL